jgi:uroporphyrin-III C-methyltransferase
LLLPAKIFMKLSPTRRCARHSGAVIERQQAVRLSNAILPAPPALGAAWRQRNLGRPKNRLLCLAAPSAHFGSMETLPPTAPVASGRVILVGAGPGAPDLLTLRAARALAAAAVVVHDGLIDPAVLELAPAARRIDVSKRRARHTLAQDAIGALLVAEAQAGHLVVRLKGGDPFIFGRGGEEVEACVAAGVDVEVIPGVSSALGAAAAALMPLTHRDHASSVSFVAGQCKGLTEQNWAGLAGVGRTLVIYMGVTAAEAIADKLIADGLAPDTPCAVLERGTLPGSRVLRTLLADLGGTVARGQVISPALLVVGAVAKLGVADSVLRQVSSPEIFRGVNA